MLKKECGKPVRLRSRGWEVIGERKYHPCGTTLYDRTPVYCDECEKIIEQESKK